MIKLKRPFFNPTHKIVPRLKFDPTHKLSIIKQHRETIEAFPCPKCQNKNLKVISLEEGDKGWEAEVNCPRCLSAITLNDLGFKINFTDGTKK